MRKVLVATIIFTVTRSAMALDLAGFELGAELTDSNRGDLTRNEKGWCSATTCRGPTQLGDFSAIVTVEVNAAGRIQAVMVQMPVKKRSDLMTAAVEKFGKPAKTTVSTVQNVFGAQFSQVTASWKFKEGVVEFVDRSGTITESCIVAISSGHISPDANKKLKL